MHYSASMTVSYETDLFYFANAVFVVSNSCKGKSQYARQSVCIYKWTYLYSCCHNSQWNTLYIQTRILHFMFTWVRIKIRSIKTTYSHQHFEIKKVFRHLLYKAIVKLSLMCSLRLNNNVYGTMLFLKWERLPVYGKDLPCKWHTIIILKNHEINVINQF